MGRGGGQERIQSHRVDQEGDPLSSECILFFVLEGAKFQIYINQQNSYKDPTSTTKHKRDKKGGQNGKQERI